MTTHRTNRLNVRLTNEEREELQRVYDAMTREELTELGEAAEPDRKGWYWTTAPKSLSAFARAVLLAYARDPNNKPKKKAAKKKAAKKNR